MNKPLKIDLEEILHEKLPKVNLPKPVVRFLKRTIHLEEINECFVRYPNSRGIEFARDVLAYLDATISIENIENLPHGGRYIFVSNHPLGGLDGVALAYHVGREYEGKVRLFANDFLMYLEPLSDILIPVNKVGGQGRENLERMQQFYESENHLITFPAGVCSRKVNGKITDLEWKKHFVAKAVEYQRDVVPIYFQGRNSDFFYNLSNFRKFCGIKLNMEMLFLPDEMFKQKGNHFTVKIGKPIAWQTYDKSKTYPEWAERTKKDVYSLSK
ncbi:MAG: 1-acyl-sn-glycerol-3-phosphate acyltransferase [Prevotellaceae bacterium]|jgi:putative hemolysin|nr:1-acyl-sn-glycerol-3-phosphate acyltransferase [Prevotellaceae bacterium]